MLGSDSKYPVLHPKAKLWRYSIKNSKNPAVKHSTEKPILLNFINLSQLFVQDCGIAWKRLITYFEKGWSLKKYFKKYVFDITFMFFNIFCFCLVEYPDNILNLCGTASFRLVTFSHKYCEILALESFQQRFI